MKKKVYIKTESAPQPLGAYSQAIKVGNWLFISGQLPLNPLTGELISENTAEQAKQVFENLKAILKAAGMDLKNVVKITLYLKNLEDFPTINKIYEEYFREVLPARSTIQATPPRNASLEVDAVACLL
ncbi:MAG: Rid family detoxifying hydrolase [Candidatus Bathyarchaeia archaeon]|nr:Rid family detoxifying hydrolase [Candidatus Bathyarchaeota archaeon]